jgi:hypothetical protein
VDKPHLRRGFYGAIMTKNRSFGRLEMTLLDDEVLLETLHDAIKHNLDIAFIQLLQAEAERRWLI